MCLNNSSLSLIAKLYSNYSINRSVVQSVISDISEIFSEPLEILQQKVLHLLNDDDKLEIGNLFESLKDPFKNLKSEHLRIKHFESCDQFIPVQSVKIGERKDCKKNQGTTVLDLVNCYVQYIPLKKTIHAFLEIPSVYDEIINYINFLNSNNQILTNIIQAKLWSDIKVKFNGKFVIPLLLYFDDFEVENPLGSHAGVHKIGAVYFTVATLPPESASQLENIFLASLHYSEDRKYFGNLAIFKRLIDDLVSLYEEGISIIVKGNVTEQIHFCPLLVLGDNLGVHSLLGYSESFVASYFCRFCRCDKITSQNQVKENKSLLRNLENYNTDLTNFSNGIREPCIWNVLPNFHVTQNLSCDIMHDLYEGVCRYDLGHILYELIYVQKYFSLDTLNNRIIFFNFLSGNSPPPINKSHIMKRHIVMSASEMKNLTKYLGLIIGDLVKENNIHWKIYLLLCDILDIIDSKSVLTEYKYQLESLIQEHHELYINCFGPLKSKHHFLLHYPGLLENLGPLTNVSSIRYEARHKQFKTIANTINSRRNIPYSLAVKNQLAFCHRILAKNGVLRKIESGKEDNTFKMTAQYQYFIVTYPKEVTENYFATKWVKIEGNTYSTNNLLLLDYYNFLPTFGKISSIILSEDDVYFLLEKKNTISFNEHLHAFEITSISYNVSSENFKSLCDTTPYVSHVLSCNKSYVVI